MDIQLLQILSQMVNFGVVVAALTVLLYKPVLKILDERSQKVEAAQKAADASLLEKKALDDTRKELIAQAEKDAQEIVSEAKKDAKRIEKEIIAKAEVAAEDEINKQRQRLADDYKSAIKELRQSFVAQVAVMTEKVVGQVVDEKVITKKLDDDIQAIIAKI